MQHKSKDSRFSLFITGKNWSSVTSGRIKNKVQLHLEHKDSCVLPQRWASALPPWLVQPFPQEFPFQWEDRLRGKRCSSRSSPSSTDLTLTYMHPHLSCSFQPSYCVPIDISHYTPPPRFIRNPPQDVFTVKNLNVAQINTVVCTQESHNPHCAEILFSNFGEIIIH